MNRTLAPPIGITPRNIWEERTREVRIAELKATIMRYLEANWPIDQRWVDELNEYLAALPRSE